MDYKMIDNKLKYLLVVLLSLLLSGCVNKIDSALAQIDTRLKDLKEVAEDELKAPVKDVLPEDTNVRVKSRKLQFEAQL